MLAKRFKIVQYPEQKKIIKRITVFLKIKTR